MNNNLPDINGFMEFITANKVHDMDSDYKKYIPNKDILPILLYIQDSKRFCNQPKNRKIIGNTIAAFSAYYLLRNNLLEDFEKPTKLADYILEQMSNKIKKSLFYFIANAFDKSYFRLSLIMGFFYEPIDFSKETRNPFQKAAYSLNAKDKMIFKKVEPIKNDELVEYEVPWTNIFFHSGYVNLYYKNATVPFKVNVPSSNEDFNRYRKEICDYLPKIIVDVDVRDRATIVALKNDAFSSRSIRLAGEELPPGIIDVKPKPMGMSNYTQEDVNNYLPHFKSRYLEYLHKNQLLGVDIYYIKERMVYSTHEEEQEEAFLFTLLSDSQKTIFVYENVNDCRSSIVFASYTQGREEAVRTINQYFSSIKVNKRDFIERNTFKFENSSIYEIQRVIHSNFYDWKSAIRKLITSM